MEITCHGSNVVYHISSGDIGGGNGGGGGGGRIKPIDLIHLVNPIEFLKEPLDNIVSKLGSATGKFGKAVGKHLVKGLEAIVDGLDSTVVDGLKVCGVNMKGSN